MNWHPLPYQALLNGNYSAISEFYEEAIEQEPEIISHYWYLGLSYLLQEQEEAAQSTWIYAMTQGFGEEMESEMLTLGQILNTEAERQETIQNYALALLIRRNLQELDASSINNLLRMVKLEILANSFSPKLLYDWQVFELLNDADSNCIDRDLLLEVVIQVLEFSTLASIDFAEISLPHIINKNDLIAQVMSIAIRMGYDEDKPTYAAYLTEFCLKIEPQNINLLSELLTFYLRSNKTDEIIKTAQRIYNIYINDEACSTISLKLYSIYRAILGFLHSGGWLEIDPILEQYKSLLLEVVNNPPEIIENHLIDRWIEIAAPLLYLADNPSENRRLINGISQIFEKQVKMKLKTQKFYLETTKIKPTKKIKIGYIASTLRKNSVGWLSRWLFHYHNREQFQIGLYLMNQPEDELTQNWFRNKVDYTYNFGRDIQEILQQIQADDLDILVDLDSLTNNVTCQVLVFKPAKIQVSWLGYDSSGLSTLDYFISDPYVLPENAQDYYQENIWRLPQTYLAVDGFEIGEQTLTREQLNIPEDAIIYWTGQNGFKRHPDMINCQMQILQDVPNSYLLIKGIGNDEKIQQLFKTIALKYQVSPDRLRFLPIVADELTHRANLQIADIVLDTYPYNGATTTLEVLWMGIPLVTRVGEQFAARNSYTFMTNVGLTEGIAWTNEEYIDWGIQLGKNEALRQQVREKLQQSRQTSPVWNAKIFTQEMEKAYQKMVKNYLDNTTA